VQERYGGDWVKGRECGDPPHRSGRWLNAPTEAFSTALHCTDRLASWQADCYKLGKRENNLKQQ